MYLWIYRIYRNIWILRNNDEYIEICRQYRNIYEYVEISLEWWTSNGQ